MRRRPRGSGVVPNRNLHTAAEVCSLSDIDAAVRLLAAFVTAVTPDTDFRPFRPRQVTGRGPAARQRSD